MKLHEYDEFELGSGQFVYANRHIIGIDPDLGLYGGYDGGICDRDWTEQERIELADYMIGLWTKYKYKVRDR